MTPETPEVIPYEYGIMSYRYILWASNKLTAYATMVFQYQQSAHMIIVYSPETTQDDIWANPTGEIAQRLDEIFGGEGAFDDYLKNHVLEIEACYHTIERIV